jgi:hypothetical protein
VERQVIFYVAKIHSLESRIRARNLVVAAMLRLLLSQGKKWRCQGLVIRGVFATTVTDYCA